MTAAVLCIGTELTRGELVNTNASWLSDRLTALGLDVAELACVPDDLGLIEAALLRLARSTQTIVCTGGLGPTSDDLTAEAAARAAGVDRVRHMPSFEAIKRRYAARGRTINEMTAQQADLPRGSEALANAVGTAPGFALELGPCRCWFLPGVPREMKQLFASQVAPTLARTAERKSHQIRLRTFGLPESEVAARLDGLETEDGSLRIGYRASFPEIEVKVLATAADEPAAIEQARETAEIVRARLGDTIYGDGDETYAVAVGRALRNRGLTVAVAESCTGGMIGEMLTSVPGSSDYLILDAVTYSNASKEDVLGVRAETLRAYGAVSEETAVAMADGVRRRADADLAVSVTGIAGPGGGTEKKPVGTVWIALAERGRPARAREHRLAGDREQIRRRTAYLALQQLLQATASAGR